MAIVEYRGPKNKNLKFAIWRNDDGTMSMEASHLCVLMDIRDELQKLNSLLACHNFTGIPSTLRTISKKLAKPRK